MEKQVPLTQDEQIQALKNALTRACIAQVMARNNSHNVGMHVMNMIPHSKDPSPTSKGLSFCLYSFSNSGFIVTLAVCFSNNLRQIA